MTNKKLIIIGAGETAQIAFEYFTYDSNYEIAAFAVNQRFLKDENLYDRPIIAIEEIEKEFPPDKFQAFVAISSGSLNRNRKAVFNEMKRKGYQLASYISSKAFVWRNVKIGENCFIFENNTVQPFVEIGNNVILWSGNHIGHNSKIADHCFISSHCVVSGFCEIGEHSFLGVNCTIENNVKIGKDNFIGAGALIQKNTKDKNLFQCKPTELSRVDTHRLFRIRE
jgi:sugar O-acyltransferase (sialic acid O-acetyltransferase NeuD family)